MIRDPNMDPPVQESMRAVTVTSRTQTNIQTYVPRMYRRAERQTDNRGGGGLETDGRSDRRTSERTDGRKGGRQTYRQTDRQTDRETDRRHACRQADRLTDRQTDKRTAMTGMKLEYSTGVSSPTS